MGNIFCGEYFGGKYLWRGTFWLEIFMAGNIFGGKYFWREIFFAGNILAGVIFWREIFLVGKLIFLAPSIFIDIFKDALNVKLIFYRLLKQTFLFFRI